MQEQAFRWTEMTMGTCYYPEHWDESLWESDLDRMLDAGITCIRIAEFAWNKVEPAEGVFTFDYFDRFLDLCEAKGMKVIFGTPTATPPAWLTEKYPEVLNANRDGVLYRHGARRHYNYNSPKYQELSARIVEKEAEHYAKHPAIVGWQIDNELNCETFEFYSEADSAAFREFLKEKYGTLDALNKAWGTVFWNQTYTDWDQIHVMRPLLSNGNNPHQHLDYYRFISYSCIRFCEMQADIIRKYRKPGDYITTNGKFWSVDNHRMTDECLDVYTYDCYPNFAYMGGTDPLHSTDLNDRRWTMHLNEVRSICPNFGIMEEQSGPGGWTTRMDAPSPRPGQLTLWAMMGVAHGADYMSFFRWRTCTQGTEIYWHGILNYDNRDNRRLAEVKDFYRKLRTLDPVCNASYDAAFSVIHDYDNMWDTSVDKWHAQVWNASEMEIFKTSELTHTPYDLVHLDRPDALEKLMKCPVAVYSHPIIISRERVDILKQYVANGGTLIIGCRSGYKDMTGQCVMAPMPGLFQELTGTDIMDFTFASPAEPASTATFADGETVPVPTFNDILTPLEGTEVLARYDGCYYKGEAAVTSHSYGKGCVIHVGSTFSQELLTELLKRTGVLNPYAGLIDAPEEAQLVLRRKDGRSFLFVLNFASEEITVTLKQPMRDMYTDTPVSGEQKLPVFGTAVFEV